MPYDLFVSYTRQDNTHGRVADLVQQIRDDHRAFTGGQDLAVFFDTAEIRGMDDWRHGILEGLRDSRLLLVCLSPEYLASEYCEWEFNEYVKHETSRALVGEGVAPIYVVEVPGWEGRGFEQRAAEWVGELRRRQHVDLRAWFDEGAAALKDAAVKQRMEELRDQLQDRLGRIRATLEAKGNIDRYNERFVGRTEELRRLREQVGRRAHGRAWARWHRQDRARGRPSSCAQPRTLGWRPPSRERAEPKMASSSCAPFRSSIEPVRRSCCSARRPRRSSPAPPTRTTCVARRRKGRTVERTRRWSTGTSSRRTSGSRTRRQADHVAVKLRAVGRGIAPLADPDAEPIELSAEEVELLAELEHERWMAERLFEGWTHAPPHKDVAHKTRPDLVPWHELPEAEKEKDRCTVRELPALLAMAGLRVFRLEGAEAGGSRMSSQ